mmetsp:Transcript_3653/g.8068  ORF Transcript_3653/g.8068 Transcript_3653/m.8068 type:complete len:214 (-) Transcript_3653:394-1035(-)
MSVQLGNNDTPHIDRRMECQCLIVHRLSLRGIHHKNRIIGRHRRVNLLHLLKQRLLLTMPPARIHDDHLVPIAHEPLHSLLGNEHRIGLGVRSVKRHAQLRRVLFQLIERPGAKGIGADHGGLPSPPLVIVRVLGDAGGFSRALESHEEDDVGLSAFHFVRFDYCGAVVGAVVAVDFGGEHGGQFIDHGALYQSCHVGVGIGIAVPIFVVGGY